MNQVDTAVATGAHVHHRQRAGVAQAGPFLRQLGRRAGTFLWHLSQMCVAMMIGMMVLGGPYFGVARLFGYSDPARQLPELTALVMAFTMTVPMAAWMRYRMRHDWRCTAEMAGAMGGEAVLVIGAAWLGLLSRSEIVSWEHALMLPAMLVPMLYRLDLYSDGAHYRAHAGPHPAGAHARQQRVGQQRRRPATRAVGRSTPPPWGATAGPPPPQWSIDVQDGVARFDRLRGPGRL